MNILRNALIYKKNLPLVHSLAVCNYNCVKLYHNFFTLRQKPNEFSMIRDATDWKYYYYYTVVWINVNKVIFLIAFNGKKKIYEHILLHKIHCYKKPLDSFLKYCYRRNHIMLITALIISSFAFVFTKLPTNLDSQEIPSRWYCYYWKIDASSLIYGRSVFSFGNLPTH